MKILITGSKGLIGTALKVALRELQIDVVELDLKDPSDLLSYGSILDGNLVFSKVDQVDGIVHLAAVSRVIDGEKNPELCWQTNVFGTQNIVNAALESERNPWIIYASSREVYGEQHILPVPETAPLRPLNIYGESKREAEKIVTQAQGLVTSIVRFSNVFGSIHDHPDRVVPAFCRAAAEGTNIRIDGRNNLFDFTYIDDVVRGLLSLISLISRSENSIEPIHFTRGVGVSLEEIALFAKAASNFPIEIIEKPPRSFDVSNFYGDPTRAKNVLNWEATISVQEGMLRLIDQFRSIHVVS